MKDKCDGCGVVIPPDKNLTTYKDKDLCSVCLIEELVIFNEEN